MRIYKAIVKKLTKRRGHANVRTRWGTHTEFEVKPHVVEFTCCRLANPKCDEFDNARQIDGEMMETLRSIGATTPSVYICCQEEDKAFIG